MWRKRLRAALRVAVYLLFLAVCVEVALQGFYYVTAGAPLFARNTGARYVADPFSGYRVRGGLDLQHKTNEFDAHVYTNSRGFRVSERREEFDYAKPAGTYRILLLGPSFAFGWAVDYEQAFGTLLAAELERSGFAERVELINAGVPSQGPWERLRWYQGEGQRYEPDLVIQVLYGSMALRRPGPPMGLTPDGDLVQPGLTAWRKLQMRAKKSAIVFYAWLVSTRMSGATDDSSAGAVSGAGRELEMAQDFDPEGPKVRESMEYYEEMARTASEHGARLLFVYTPLAYGVHEADIARWRHLGVYDIGRQAAFDRAFCEHLDDLGMPCFNTTPVLVDAAQRSSERLYYWVDIHWTPEGNRVAADAVARYLAASRGEAPEPER